MRTLPLVLFLATGCGAKALKECQAGQALTPSEHLARCAALIKAPACRQYVLELDGGTLEPWAFAERCHREYCGRFGTPVAFCLGERGAPLDGYAPELGFLTAVFELDHGAASPLAKEAFFEAARRQSQAQLELSEQAKQEEQRNARLIVDLDGDRESLTVTFARPGGVAGYSGSAVAFGPPQCAEFIARALDGGSLDGQVVLVRGGKNVMWRSMRCVVDAALDAGASAGNVGITVKSR